MEPYGGGGHTSGVREYEIRADAIVVKFGRGGVYVYSHESAGWHHVERMKLLARQGEGLTSYINRHVRDSYER